MIIPQEVVRDICSFASGENQFSGLGAAALEKTYDWPIPQSAESLVGDLEGASPLARTLDLKRKLNALWHSKPDARREIAKWIVTDWGGVRGNRADTLEAHFQRAEGRDRSTPFTGVSSYSKILAVVDPQRHAILDARVAVSLNAIQVLAGTRNGLAFPYISGRNNITGNQGSKRGFATLSQYSVNTLVRSRGWTRVARDDAYSIYSGLLHQCCSQNSLTADISVLEMALFSQAKELALRVEPGLAS